MKRIKITHLWTVVMLCMVTLFASCAKDDNVSEPTPEPTPVTQPTTYTVMLYGCAGSNLDGCLTYNLKQVETAGKMSRVNFRALVKYSKGSNQDKHPGTRLITMTEKGLTEEQAHDANYRLDNPAHLTDFIKESKEKMPADKYILIIWNHGSIFGVDDGPVAASYPETGTQTKAAVFDDNIDGFPALSTLAVEKAIKDTGEKIDLVYYDVCLMGMVETYTQLKDVTHYAMGAINLTPGQGGNYARLMTYLQENDSIEDAIKAYIPGLMNDFKASEQNFADVSCFDLTYIDELNQHIKSATDELVRWRNEMRTANPEENIDDFEAMQNYLSWLYYMKNTLPEDSAFAPLIKNTQNETEELVAYWLKKGGAPCSTDLVTALSRCATLNDQPNGVLSGYTTLISNTIKKMTIATGSINPPNTMAGVSMGITWPYALTLAKMESSQTYLANLEGSAFNKATGWTTFMKQLETEEVTWLNNSTLFANDYYYYWGNKTELLKKPSYYWTVELTTTDDNLSQETHDQIAKAEEKAQTKFDKATFPLFYGRGLAEHVYRYLKNELYRYQDLRHITIRVSLQEGQDETLNSDADNEKYPHSVEKTFLMY